MLEGRVNVGIIEDTPCVPGGLRSQAFAIITPSLITRLPSKPGLGHCVIFEAPESSEDGQKVMVLLSVLWEPSIL